MVFKSKKGHLCRFLPKTLMSYNLFRLLLLFFTPLFCGFFLIQKVNAQPLSLGTSQITWRPDPSAPFDLTTINHPNHLVPANFLTLNSASFLQIRRINFSGQIQTAKGSSFSGDISFRLSVNTEQEGFLYQPGWNCDWIAEVKFKPEQGTVLSQNSQISSCKVTSTGSIQSLIDITLSTSGTLSQSTSISSFYVSILNRDGVIYSAETNPSYSIYLTIWNADVNFIVTEDPNTEILGTINQGITDINNNLEDQQQQENAAIENIENQDSSDISGAENQATTNLIGVLSSFISAFSGINATNCNLTLEFPDFAGGSRVVDICQGKEKAPRIVEIGSSLLLIGIFVPLAYILIKMIYNEIRSFTNG